MFSIKFLRKAAVASIAAAAVTVPALASVASAAPADKGPDRDRNNHGASQASDFAVKRFMANRRNEGVCVQALIDGQRGWSRVECGDEVEVGTTGRSQGIEALRIMPIRLGGLTIQGHVQDRGWERTERARDGQWVTVGDLRGDKRLEAVRVDSRSDIALQGHVQDIGWQRWSTNRGRGPAVAGTEGQSKRLEALRINAG
ncbi:hypothetical protein [Symbioplanes lichenis]|uniref:hypothetical protein n=1 Tax=Symbioplanes lichenis TaxID=1629072 RepID=UPI0027385AC9|nr:hypothetical protein [Actinoplanes lichenis]